MTIEPCLPVNSHMLHNDADDWLDPYQYRLYGRYCRVCQEAEDGICREGTRELAKQCHMSVGKVAAVRQWLKEQGYIALKEGAGDQPFETTLLERSPREQGVHHMNTNEDGVQEVNATVHHMNDTVHEGESVHHMNTNASHTSAGKDKSLKTNALEQKDKSGGGDNADARAKVFDQYTALTKHGIDSLIVSQQLLADVEDFTQEWIDEAVSKAALNGVTNWNYVRKMLQAWKRDGREVSRPATVKGKFSNGNGAHAPPPEPQIPLTSKGAPILGKVDRHAKTN